MKILFTSLSLLLLFISCGPVPEGTSQANEDNETETTPIFEIVSTVSQVPNEQLYKAYLHLIILNDTSGVTLEEAASVLEKDSNPKKPSEYFVVSDRNKRLLFDGRNDLSGQEMTQARRDAKKDAKGYIYTSAAGTLVTPEDEIY